MTISGEHCIRPAANWCRYHVRIKCNCSCSKANSKIVFRSNFSDFFLPSFRFFFPSPTAQSLHVCLFYCSHSRARQRSGPPSAAIIQRSPRSESLAIPVRSKFVAAASRKKNLPLSRTPRGFRYVTLFDSTKFSTQSVIFLPQFV